MDDSILKQLLELASAFAKINLKPVICGGLGIYLSMYNRKSDLSIRTTNDIDLMLTNRQIADHAYRKAIAEIITDQLEYKACKDGKYFMFEKNNRHFIDILIPPVDGIEAEGFRAKIVKSCLHGYITPEAQFIQEDMRTISLSELITDCKEAEGLEVFIPSPTNLLLMKLFAFNDRDLGARQDDNKARAHAFDIYTIITLTSLQDYKECKHFISRHKDSEIIHKAISIVESKFSSEDNPGWIRVLENTTFYPDLNIRQKREKIRSAKARLTRWFSKDNAA